MVVEDGTVVHIHYTLTDDAGETLDTSAGGAPLAYLHGAQNLVPGLEHALGGKGVGDTLQVTVPPEQGYGQHSGESETVPRNMFPEGMELEPGMPLRANVPGEGAVVMWIEAVHADNVQISMNHPLAGKNLHFDVEVVEIRDATDEEKAHGHVHDGSHH